MASNSKNENKEEKLKIEASIKIEDIRNWFIFAFLMMLIAVFVKDIITIALAFISLGLVFAPAIIGTFFFKARLKNKAIQLSLVTGVISVLIVLFAGFIGPETSTISLPVSTVFLIAGQYIWKNSKD